MVPELVSCLERTMVFMRGAVDDLSDEELLLQPAGVPNHAAWTLGHVIHSWQAMACELGVEPWLSQDWEVRFAYGTIPAAGSAPAVDTSTYSRKDELLTALADAGDRLRAAILASGEARLSAPMPDAEARAIFPTLGHALLQVVAAHTAFHAGQLAMWRRAIGRKPVGVFI